EPSLGVTPVSGKVLINCSAGCKTEDVMAALGMTMRDLFDNEDGRQTATTKRLQPLPSERQVSQWAEELSGDRYWTKRRKISRDVLRLYEIGWDAKARSKDGRVGAYTIPY